MLLEGTPVYSSPARRCCQLVMEQVPDAGELTPDTGGPPAHIKECIARLGKQPRRAQLRSVIYAVCALGEWMTSAELAELLNFRQSNLTATHLRPMVDSGLLERRYPRNLNHPRQAYRAVSVQPDGQSL